MLGGFMLDLEEEDRALLIIEGKDKVNITPEIYKSLLEAKINHGYKVLDITTGEDFIVRFVKK